ncbi:hypothetical protein JB92DRAFT_3085502 [Gautieria morchelliformis]|nr:hypothetical protein JB92DRAFT_3085502 [Gautieria morchelliformis]
MASGVHRAANGTSATRFELGLFDIDELRPLRVAVIGAGYSGIIAGLRVIPNVELVIYEKLAGVGGVWSLHWSAFYAPGSQIKAYLKGVVDKYKLMRYIKLNHELTNAIWDSAAGKWNLTLSTLQGDIQDAADTVINCLFGFNGRVVHSARWNLEKEREKEAWEGKDIAVIGVGSSAIQIVPRVQPKADKVANLVRGKTYHFTEAEHWEFEDPEYYAQFRHKIEEELKTSHRGSLRMHPMQPEAVKKLREAMVQKSEKSGIAERLIPNFPVSCRRLTPGPGYLEALKIVELVTETIKRLTPDGIETADGKHREFDIIACATGFDTTWKPPYTVIGRDGLKLQENWTISSWNLLPLCSRFLSLGPNPGVNSGSLLILKTIEVKTAPVKDFDEYLEVLTYCYQTLGKEEGRVAALWPGACLRAVRALAHPHWEDFNYESLDGRRNRFYWLGDGWTVNERQGSGNRAYNVRQLFE